MKEQLLDRLSGTLLALSGGTLLLNLATFRRPSGRLPAVPPPVSILVPARNEARSIGRCLSSLLALDYPDLEVIVLDDGSTDETAAILAGIAAGRPAGADPRLRLLQGRPRPAGWSGKCWACHQLAAEAAPRSRYLLFTDADTRHAPESLSRTVAALHGSGDALLSLLPEQEVRGWAESAMVPLLALQILGFLPVPLMTHFSEPRLAAANGQYMLFDRAVYNRIGGHRGVARTLVEDVALARAVRTHGAGLRLANGAGLVRCRMYDGLGESLAGFRRSYGAGARMDPWLLLLLVGVNVGAYLLPLLRLGSTPAARRQAGFLLLLRAALARRTGTSARGVLLHLPGIVLTIWVQIMALVDARRKRPQSWKGREYDGSGSEEVAV